MGRLRRLSTRIPHAAKRWGDHYFRRGRLRRAVACYRFVVPLRRPVGPFARLWLSSLWRIGRIETAIGFHRELLARVPRHQPSSHIIANLLDASGQAQPAEAQYRSTLELDVTHAGVRFDFLQFLLRAQRYAEAEAIYRSLAGLAPEDPNLLPGLVEILTAHGRWSEAVSVQQRIASIAPRDLGARQRLGELLLEQNRLVPAIETFRELRERDPSGPDVHRSLGEALTRAGQLDEAVQSFAQAAQIERRIADSPPDAAFPAMAIVVQNGSDPRGLLSVLANQTKRPVRQLGLGSFPDDRIVAPLLAETVEGKALGWSGIDGRPENRLQLRDAGVERLLFHIRDPRDATEEIAQRWGAESSRDFAHERLHYRPAPPANFQYLSPTLRLDWAVENTFPGQIDWLKSWFDGLDVLEKDFQVLVTTQEEVTASPDGVARRLAEFYGLEALPRIPAAQSFWVADPNAAHRARMTERIPAALRERFGWN